MTTGKSFVLVLTLGMSADISHAQGVAIGSGNPVPAATALLDLQSTTQGLLPPRMTTAQRTAIASPATGLVVYDTSLGGLYLRTSTAWVSLSTGTNWSLAGNAGTNPATDFVGTTDAQPLVFKVSNQTAGYVDTTYRNVALGRNTLNQFASASATNSRNVGIGNKAMAALPTSALFPARGNVAVGDSTMANWSFGGSRNTMIGQLAGTQRGSTALPVGGANADDNVAIGYRCMRGLNGIARNNAAVGSGSMENCGVSKNNAAVGFEALKGLGGALDVGDWNTAIGYQALYGSSYAYDCAALGDAAGKNLSEPYLCTFIGAYANSAGASPIENRTALGANALVTQDNSVVLGSIVGVNGALSDTRVGIGTTSPSSKLEVANGAFGLSNTADAKKWELNYDAALDVLAFEETGAAKQLVVKNGGNVGIGTTNPTSKLQVEDGNLALNNTADSKRWELGYEPSGTDDYFYIDEYGAGRRFAIKAGGNVGIGVTNPGQKLQVAGNICASGTIGACSDRRFKKDIAPLTGALDKVRLMRGVSYTWRTDEFPERAFSTDRQIGFIAQDIERLYPEAVQRDGEGYLSVDYARLVPVLVEAIKEQQTRIEEQQRANIAQQARLDAQAEELRAIRTELRSMSVTSSKNP